MQVCALYVVVLILLILAQVESKIIKKNKIKLLKYEKYIHENIESVINSENFSIKLLKRRGVKNFSRSSILLWNFIGILHCYLTIGVPYRRFKEKANSLLLLSLSGGISLNLNHVLSDENIPGEHLPTFKAGISLLFSILSQLILFILSTQIYYKLLFEYKECLSFKDATHIYIADKNKLRATNTDVIMELQLNKKKDSIKSILNNLSIIEKPSELLQQLQDKNINVNRKRLVKQYVYRDLTYKILKPNKSNTLYILPQVPIIATPSINSSQIITGGIINDDIVDIRRTLFGSNNIPKVLPTFWSQFKRMYISNMAIMQLLSHFLSVLIEPIFYPMMRIIVDLLMDSVEIIRNVYSAKEMYNLAKISSMNNKYEVLRNGKVYNESSLSLVPGDIVYLREGTKVPADILLLSGSSIINEAILTGETVPNPKFPLAITTSTSSVIDNINVMTGGTDIIQVDGSENKLIGLVIATGKLTQQGILATKVKYIDDHLKYGTKMQRDDSKLILILLYSGALFASFLFFWATKVSGNYYSNFMFWIQVSRIFLVMIPPDINSSLLYNLNQGVRRLSAEKVYCNDPIKLAVAGQIDTCLFDKTGTITSNDIEFTGLYKTNAADAVLKLTIESQILISSCINILYARNGQLCGDQIDTTLIKYIKKMYNQWDIHNENQVEWNNYNYSHGSDYQKIKIEKLNSYPFDPLLQRMSVVVNVTYTLHDNSSSSSVLVVAKGSPESILNCCIPSTVDDIYREKYHSLASQGNRILSIGYKILDPNITYVDMQRSYVENNLLFHGFLSFVTPLRTDSKEAIRMLTLSKYNLAMVTGDSIYTAIACGKECNLMLNDAEVLILSKDEVNQKYVWTDSNNMKKFDYKIETKSVSSDDSLSAKDLYDMDGSNLAISGATLKELLLHHPSLRNDLSYFKIYARIDPETKGLIVNLYQEKGNLVLMCGDGSNDMHALKSADVGLALIQEINYRSNNMYSDSKDNDTMNSNDVFEMISKVKEEEGLSDSQAMWKAFKQMKQKQSIKDASLHSKSQLVIGDASMAAPFTSHNPSIMAVLHALRHGKAAYALICQTYQRIFADSLLTGFSMSLLAMDKVTFSQSQLMTMSCISSIMDSIFLFIRPLPHDINTYKVQQDTPHLRKKIQFSNIKLIMKNVIHISIHMWCLYCVRSYCNGKIPVKSRNSSSNKSDKIVFHPNPTSNVAFYFNIIETIMLPYVTYVGMPYIKEYKDIVLLKQVSIIGIFIVLILASEFFPILNKSLSLYVHDSGSGINSVTCCFILLHVFGNIVCKNIVK